MTETFFQKLQSPETVIQVGEVNRLNHVIRYGENFNIEDYVGNNPDKNLYFLAGIKEGVTGRAKDQDIITKNYIGFDFDIREYEKKMGRGCNDDQLLKNAKEILEALNLHELFKDYSYAVLSGNGLHVYYFGESIKIYDPGVFKSGMSKLVEEISSITIPADKACVNPGRLFRIPGSINQKNKNRCEILESRYIKSELLSKVMEYGEEALFQRVKTVSVQEVEVDSTYDAINKVPIEEMVCEIFNWEYNNDRHFNEPGQSKKKACFVGKDGNYIVHGGTDHFSDEQKGYSPFQFIKMMYSLDNKETFKWFKEKYPEIQKIEDETKNINATSIIKVANNETNSDDIDMDISCIPENNFLKRLIDLYDGVTDAPNEFIITSGLLMLSTIIENKVWLKYGDNELKPHLYALIIAQSSRFRKSTVISIARNIISDVAPELLFCDENTPEAFIEHLSENPCGLFTFSEMGGFLRQMEKQYMGGLKELITDLYDSPKTYLRKLKSKGNTVNEYEINNPAINILAGSTMEWFLQNSKEGDIMSGFLPRYIITHRKTKNKKTIHVPRKVDMGKKQLLEGDLRIIKDNWDGETDLSREAYEIMYNWAVELDNEMNKECNPKLEAFYTRLSTTTLKIAIIIEPTLRIEESYNNSFKFENNNLISAQAMSIAINITKYYMKVIRNLVLNEFTYSYFEADVKKVKEIIIKNGKKISNRDLLRITKKNKGELNKILETMEASGEILITNTRTISGQNTTEITLLN